MNVGIRRLQNFALVVLPMLVASQGGTVSAAEFFVKSVTLAKSAGLFELEAEIPPSETAQLIITMVGAGADDAARLVESVNSTVPAKLVVTDKTQPTRNRLKLPRLCKWPVG